MHVSDYITTPSTHHPTILKFLPRYHLSNPTTRTTPCLRSVDLKTVLYNGTRGKKERMTHLLRPFADDLRPVEEAAEGTTVVAVGLKNTRTGDTLVLRWVVVRSVAGEAGGG